MTIMKLSAVDRRPAEEFNYKIDFQVWSPSEGDTACILPPLERELWSHSVDWVYLQDLVED